MQSLLLHKVIFSDFGPRFQPKLKQNHIYTILSLIFLQYFHHAIIYYDDALLFLLFAYEHCRCTATVSALTRHAAGLLAPRKSTPSSDATRRLKSPWICSGTRVVFCDVRTWRLNDNIMDRYVNVCFESNEHGQSYL